MENINWHRFIVRINIDSDIETLYNCFSTREGMERWFLRLCEYKSTDGSILGPKEYIKPGNVYKWLWHGWPDDTVEYGEILDCNKKDFIKFSFGKAGDCAIFLKEELNNIMVELTQDKIPEDEAGQYNYHVGCKTGWTFYLANLKSMLEGGIDLRNKNVNLKNVINS